MSQTSIRLQVTINAGAAVALLAFLGNAINKNAGTVAGLFNSALAAFAAGVTVAALVSIASYATQFLYGQESDAAKKWAPRLHVITFAAGFISLAVFVVGCKFKDREVEKRYLAIAHGQLAPVGELDTLYGRHPVDRKRFSSTVQTGKRAVTHWKTLAVKTVQEVGGAGASALQVDLLTGRTHQIRAHFADLGHPLLGDVLYGGAKRDAKLPDDAKVKQAALAAGRQALHAWLLELDHPITGKKISCTAPIPKELQAALGALGIDFKKLKPEVA